MWRISIVSLLPNFGILVFRMIFFVQASFLRNKRVVLIASVEGMQ